MKTFLTLACLLATTTFSLAQTGNVGIGTALPTAKLEVNGKIRMATANDTLASGANLTLHADDDASGNEHIALAVGGTEHMRIIANGNVGIGIVDPHAAMHFAGAVTNRKIVLFETGNNDHQFYGLGVNGNVLRYQVDIPASDHVFYAGKSAAGSKELMRIKGTGTVAIGTDAPDTSAVLDVASTSKAFILPRLTTAAINAIAVPAEGMMVYNTDSAKFWGYGGQGPSAIVSQPLQTGSFSNFGAHGQSFTAPSTFLLSAIDIYAYSFSGSLTLTMSLHSGSGTTGPVLATNTITITSSSSALGHFTFPGGVVLQNGSTYTFSAVPTGPSAGGAWLGQICSGNPYPGGNSVRRQWIYCYLGSSLRDL